MNKNNDADKMTDEFAQDLINALEEHAVLTKREEIHPFFCSRVWFFVALFSVAINIVMLGVIFWKKMRIDFLIEKVLTGG